MTSEPLDPAVTLATAGVPINWDAVEERKRKTYPYKPELYGQAAERVEKALAAETAQPRPARELLDRERGEALPAKPDIPLADLLADVAGVLRKYVVLGEDELTAVTLWTVHTWLFDEFDVTPYLAVTSPEKRSGKTRLLDVLERLVARPWRAVAPSDAVVYRKIEADHPTLLLDEVDTIWGPKAAASYEGLRALLNAGYRRGTTVPRCVGEGANLRVHDFDVFCPKALAGIGELPDTVADRSIPIRLQRKRRDERVERARAHNIELDARTLREDLAAWGEYLHGALAYDCPSLPDELDDRAQDTWEPLLAIADAAGGEWPERARKAAVALSTGHDGSEDSLTVRLLADIKSAFAVTGEERLPTQRLIDLLCEDETAPWGDWHGKQITPHSLGRLLHRYNIKARKLRRGDETFRGYEKADFADAWERYLAAAAPSQQTAANFAGPPSGGSKVEQTEQVPICRHFVENQSGTESAPVPLQKHAICRDVPLVPLATPEKGGKTLSEACERDKSEDPDRSAEEAAREARNAAALAAWEPYNAGDARPHDLEQDDLPPALEGAF